MHSFFFAFSGCRIIEIFFFTFLFFILCIAFTFQIHIHFHIFTSEVTCYFCYFCYCQIIFLLFYLFTFLPLNALLPFKLRPDAAVATSRRVWRCVPTWPSLRRDAVSGASRGGKKHRKCRLQSRETHFQIRQISFYRIRDC